MSLPTTHPDPKAITLRDTLRENTLLPGYILVHLLKNKNVQKYKQSYSNLLLPVFLFF